MKKNTVFTVKKYSFSIQIVDCDITKWLCIYDDNQFSLVLSFFLKFRGPEGQIISDELHDGCGILVLIFLDLVNVSNGIIEGLLGQLAGF